MRVKRGKLAIDWHAYDRRRDWAERPPSLRVQEVPPRGKRERPEDARIDYLAGLLELGATVLVVLVGVIFVWSWWALATAYGW